MYISEKLTGPGVSVSAMMVISPAEDVVDCGGGEKFEDLGCGGGEDRFRLAPVEDLVGCSGGNGEIRLDDLAG